MDFYLALLYGIDTKVLTHAVKRNIRRFPKDLMFLLSQKEFFLRSQIVTSKTGGTRYPPFAFTEQRVDMLSGILTSKKAWMLISLS